MTGPAQTVELVANGEDASAEVSPLLIGLFYEDLNFGADGGLNANLVNNHSFENVYLDPSWHSFSISLLTKRRPRRKVDRARHWSIENGELKVDDSRPSYPGTHYARLSVNGRTLLTNHGYPGDGPSMGAREGVPLIFTAQLRRRSFDGAIAIRLIDSNGSVLAHATVDHAPAETSWQEITATLQPTRTALASLQIEFGGSGEVELDEFSLIPEDHWGAGDPRWSQGLLRRDLVETIRDMSPSFLRFPGGCVAEGLDHDNAYDWKKTVGPVAARRGDFNLWGLNRPDGDYAQSHQLGFYEFFLLCEDLGIAPVPVVSAGVCCQLRSRETIEIDSSEFRGLVDDVVDLIDWATGDPAQSDWARIRAEAGHPEPFSLDMIGIGNENHGPAYEERFALIRAAVLDRRPDMRVILTSGASASGAKFDRAWEFARADPAQLIVDEHFYKDPKWITAAAHRYDAYDRDGAKVFVGEYAAHVPTIMTPRALRSAPNTFRSAVAEAAMLTGIVRNSDVVVMSSYAPLFNRVGAAQWEHDLIDFNAFTVQPTTNYLVQQLFASNLGTRLVPINGELPREVFASSTRDDDTQYLHLVNVGAVEQTIRIHLEPTARDVSVAVTTITADPDARNELGVEGMPQTNVRPTASAVEVDQGTITLQLSGHSVLAARVPLAGAGRAA